MKVVVLSPFDVNLRLMPLLHVWPSQSISKYSQDVRQDISYDTLVRVPVISGCSQVKTAELSLTKDTDAFRGSDGVTKDIKKLK